MTKKFSGVNLWEESYRPDISVQVKNNITHSPFSLQLIVASTQHKSVFSYCDKNIINLKSTKLRDPHLWSLGLVTLGSTNIVVKVCSKECREGERQEAAGLQYPLQGHTSADPTSAIQISFLKSHSLS